MLLSVRVSVLDIDLKDVPEVIFEKDETRLFTFSKKWTPEAILEMEGMFFLKDVARVLGFDALKIKERAYEMARQGQPPWESMGACRIFNHWLIRMKIFAPYYRSTILARIRKVQPRWNGKKIIRESGLFLLSDVCRLIPFSAHQIRHLILKDPDARQNLGVWRDEELNIFVVDMAIFGPWLHQIWKGTVRNI